MLTVVRLFLVTALFTGGVLVVSNATLTGSVADDVRAYKLMNIPPNTTGSCKSRFGEGAQAGKMDCECKGGYVWNKGKTACVSDGTPQAVSYVERLTRRIMGRFTAAKAEAVSSSSAGAVSSRPAGCMVKGTVTREGDRLYLVPGCKGYESVKVDKDRNEKTFCSEELAMKAGWAKSPVCPR